jgi:SAM-dependent methyltransferase
VWVHEKHIVDEGDPQTVVAAYHRFLQEVSEGGPDPSLAPAAVPEVESAPGVEASLDLPIPPIELRNLIGQPDPAAYDNPTGKPVFDFVDPALLARVFEFRSGCGRLARQFIQQMPPPQRYLGIEPHRGMLAWCKRNLEPAAPGFEFQHQDVYDHTLNRSFGKPRMLPFPADDGAFTFVEAWSVFPHLTEDQTAFYLGEVARILAPGGVFHGTWFLFDKRDGFPMLHEGQNALYASDAEPTAAVSFDRTWLRRQTAVLGLTIHAVWPVRPAPRGFQWHVLMSHAADGLEEVDWTLDDRPAEVV